MRQNWLEWVALVASVLVIGGIVGVLFVDGLRDEGAPPMPRIETRPDEAYGTSSGWILPATVTNDGDMAAEAVVMRATAPVSGTEEESEVTIDYLPPGTDVEISFGFSAAPEGDVEVQTVGFRLP